MVDGDSSPPCHTHTSFSILLAVSPIATFQSVTLFGNIPRQHAIDENKNCNFFIFRWFLLPVVYPILQRKFRFIFVFLILVSRNVLVNGILTNVCLCCWIEHFCPIIRSRLLRPLCLGTRRSTWIGKKRDARTHYKEGERANEEKPRTYRTWHAEARGCWWNEWVCGANFFPLVTPIFGYFAPFVCFFFSPPICHSLLLSLCPSPIYPSFSLMLIVAIIYCDFSPRKIITLCLGLNSIF